MAGAPAHAGPLAAALAERYTVAREVGRGGIATVHLARALRHDRQGALTVLHPARAAASGAEWFLSEIRTTANLQHPHILPLHDSGSAEGHLVHVMPFVDGETLRERLARETQLPAGPVARRAHAPRPRRGSGGGGGDRVGRVTGRRHRRLEEVRRPLAEQPQR